MDRRPLTSASIWLWLALAGGSAWAAPGPPRTLNEALATAGPNDRIPIIVTLSDRVDPTAFRDPDKGRRRERLVRAWQAKAASTQGPVRAWLQRRGARPLSSLWIINGISVEVKPDLIPALLRLPGVQDLTLDATLSVPAMTAGLPALPEWNLTAIRAPELWALGLRGAGVLLANMDTGVDINHPDLGASWRGGGDSWWDPYRGTSIPYDAIGHGTQTMGLMVGGDAGGTAIGVAPDASWIAAKIFDDNGNTTVSTIHLAFQWLLNPSGDPSAPDAPDVVNASWGLNNVNGCDDSFQADFEALRAAGILVVFAAGNAGPASQTSQSPANNLDAFSVGAVDDTQTIAYFSSRGPSACTNGIFPRLVAPGANVRTADISLAGLAQYAYVSGTSYAAPQVAGVAALLLGAFPDLLVGDVEGSLTAGATDLGSIGPDNGYGAGLLNALGTYDLLASGIVNQPPTAVDDAATMLRNHVKNIAALANDSDPDDGIDPGTLALVGNPAHGTAVANLDGTLTYTPMRGFVGTDQWIYEVRDYQGAASNPATVTVTVRASDLRPVAHDDSAATPKGTPVTIAVLANDADPDDAIDPASVQIVGTPAHGTFLVNPDGTVTYTPKPKISGIRTFRYRVRDVDGLLSNTATVTVTIGGSG